MYLALNEVHHRLIIDELDVLESDLFVRVDCLLFLEGVPGRAMQPM